MSRCLEPFFNKTYFINWVKTSWAYSKTGMVKDKQTNNIQREKEIKYEITKGINIQK